MNMTELKHIKLEILEGFLGDDATKRQQAIAAIELFLKAVAEEKGLLFPLHPYKDPDDDREPICYVCNVPVFLEDFHPKAIDIREILRCRLIALQRATNSVTLRIREDDRGGRMHYHDIGMYDEITIRFDRRNHDSSASARLFLDGGEVHADFALALQLSRTKDRP